VTARQDGYHSGEGRNRAYETSPCIGHRSFGRGLRVQHQGRRHEQGRADLRPAVHDDVLILRLGGQSALSGTGQLEIDEAQAAIVRRIFDMFASGHSPRAIASALNRDDVPSPGSSWGRQRRRKRGWVHSAINGNPARALGILNNDLYRGVVVWNRSRWIRSAADSSKRRAVQNPRKDWITRQDERLRIVSDELWQRVKARQADQAHRIGSAVKRGMSRHAAIRTGTAGKFLLSGLLRCAHCGSAYAIAGVDRYACSGHTGGGNALCANNAMLRRQVAEFEVLAGLKRELRSPEVLREIASRTRARVRQPKVAAPDNRLRVSELEMQIANLADAIAGGVLKASPALAGKLASAETELAQLQAAATAVTEAPRADVSMLLANLPKLALRAVDQLEKTLASGDVPRARTEIKDHIGMVDIEADVQEIRLYGEHGVAASLARAAGGSSHTSFDGSGGRI